MSTVCLDTNVIIFGIQHKARPEEQHKILQAQKLLEKLERDGTDITIPTVVLAEYLRGIDDDHVESALENLQKGFQIVPFDAHAAMRLAAVFRSPDDSPNAVDGPTCCRRAAVKVDEMIVATALATGASCIYSTDPHLRKLGGGRITVLGLPDDPIQQPLFPPLPETE